MSARTAWFGMLWYNVYHDPLFLEWQINHCIITYQLGAAVAEVALFHISNLGGQRNGKMYDGDPDNKIKHG